MSVLESLILGIVQGITEFLPVSSSAHLIIVPYLLGFRESPLVFDTSLHIGTALAVFVYFFKDLLKIDKNMIKFFIVASLPVMVVGALFDNYFESVFRNILFTPFFLIIGSLILWFAQKNSIGGKTLNLKKAVLMGLAQPLALFPGISRSGITISAGLFSGLSKEDATKFSFYLSLPAVCAAAGFKLLTSYKDISAIGFTPFAVGIFASFVAGILAIHFLISFVKTKSFNVFIIYRILLAAVLLFLSSLRTQ